MGWGRLETDWLTTHLLIHLAFSFRALSFFPCLHLSRRPFLASVPISVFILVVHPTLFLLRSSVRSVSVVIVLFIAMANSVFTVALPFSSSSVRDLIPAGVADLVPAAVFELVDLETAYQVRDLVASLEGLQALRLPLGVLGIGVGAVLLVVLRRGEGRLPEEVLDRLEALLEWVVLLSGCVIGGAAFVLGARSIQLLRWGRFRDALRVLVGLWLVETAPRMLDLLPARPRPGLVNSLARIFY